MSDSVSTYKIECYKKIRPLGTKGTIWLVQDSVTEKIYVMHQLPLSAILIYQELQKIKHPNIVEIIDVFSHDSFLYVIEKYEDGMPLSEIIAKKPCSNRQTFYVGKQILNALITLHSHNIVHRDVKPENILIDSQGHVTLIDFDIARFFSQEKDADTNAKGSKAYAPPEQFGFAQSDCRTDIYAFGVTLNELATGKLPEQKLCSGKIGVIVRRCTQFDPKRRYQTAKQVLQHMQRLEKRTVYIFPFIALICITILATVFMAADRFLQPHSESFESDTPNKTSSDRAGSDALPENTPQDSDTEPQPDYTKKPTTGSNDSENRIISLDSRLAPQDFPFLLMQDDGVYEFPEEAENQTNIKLSATKKDERMKLSLGVPGQENADFTFEDNVPEKYKPKDFNNSKQEMSPDYEILLTDFDSDGSKDFLITLAWRQPDNSNNSEQFSYDTKYSIVWLVYLNRENEYECSKPLLLNDTAPCLEEEWVLFNEITGKYYIFEDYDWSFLLMK